MSLKTTYKISQRLFLPSLFLACQTDSNRLYLFSAPRSTSSRQVWQMVASCYRSYPSPAFYYSSALSPLPLSPNTPSLPQPLNLCLVEVQKLVPFFPTKLLLFCHPRRGAGARAIAAPPVIKMAGTAGGSEAVRGQKLTRMDRPPRRGHRYNRALAGQDSSELRPHPSSRTEPPAREHTTMITFIN